MKANINFVHISVKHQQNAKLLQQTRGNMSASRAFVLKCHGRFTDDRQNLDDNERQGREAFIQTSRATSIKTALKGDRRLTIR